MTEVYSNDYNLMKCKFMQVSACVFLGNAGNVGHNLILRYYMY